MRRHSEDGDNYLWEYHLAAIKYLFGPSEIVFEVKWFQTNRIVAEEDEWHVTQFRNCVQTMLARSEWYVDRFTLPDTPIVREDHIGGKR